MLARLLPTLVVLVVAVAGSVLQKDKDAPKTHAAHDEWGGYAEDDGDDSLSSSARPQRTARPSQKSAAGNEFVVFTIENFNKNPQTEMEFLRVQQLVFWEKERRTLERLGLKDGMHVLDLGGGPGFLSEHILRWLPNAQVTLLEVEPLFTANARERLREFEEQGRFHVVTDNVLNLTRRVEENSMDFAVARLLLQHLPDPMAVLHDVRKVLSPGGRFVVMDADEGIADIQSPVIHEIDDLYQMLEEHRESKLKHNSDGRLGRRLYSMLRTAGFSHLDLDINVASSDEVPMKHFMPLIDTTQFYPLVKAGLVKEAHMKRVQSKLEDIMLHGNGITTEGEHIEPVVMCFIFAVSGQKPGEPLTKTDL